MQWVQKVVQNYQKKILEKELHDKIILSVLIDMMWILKDQCIYLSHHFIVERYPFIGEEPAPAPSPETLPLIMKDQEESEYSLIKITSILMLA